MKNQPGKKLGFPNLIYSSFYKACFATIQNTIQNAKKKKGSIKTVGDKPKCLLLLKKRYILIPNTTDSSPFSELAFIIEV